MSLEESKILLRDLVPPRVPIVTPFSWKQRYLDSDRLECLIHLLCLLKGNNLIASPMYQEERWSIRVDMGDGTAQMHLLLALVDCATEQSNHFIGETIIEQLPTWAEKIARCRCC